MSEYLASTLLSQMQNFRGEEVEALVVGIEDENAAIYQVDTTGTVACADDVGFAAIGSGAWHARSRLMQSGYTNSLPYFAALASVYAAKKSADISPGVGSQTDIHIAFRDQTERLVPETNAKLAELYDRFRAESDDLAQKAVESLYDFVVEQKKVESEQKVIGSSGGDANDNESVVRDAPKQHKELKETKISKTLPLKRTAEPKSV